MASVKKIGPATWQVRWRDPAGQQKAKNFGRAKDAKDWCTQLDVDLRDGDYLDPARGRIAVAVLAPKWLAAQGHLKATTAARYAQQLNKHILPRWGATPVGRVVFEDVAAWVGELETELSAASVRDIFRVFSLLLDFAVKAKRIRRNPAAGVKLPRARKSAKRYLTHQQVVALADAAGDYRPWVLLAAYTGLRFGELAALRVGRVDLMRRRITVAEAVAEVKGKLVWSTPKSHQTRTVPIGSMLADELAGVVAGKGPEDLLFTTRRGAVLRNLNFRRDVLDQAAKDAGVPGLTPHELRHTAASLAVSAGANVKVVQRMLGHESARMTLDVYSDLFEDDLDQVAERMDSAARVHELCTDAEVLEFPDAASNSGTVA